MSENALTSEGSHYNCVATQGWPWMPDLKPASVASSWWRGEGLKVLYKVHTAYDKADAGGLATRTPLR